MRNNITKEEIRMTIQEGLKQRLHALNKGLSRFRQNTDLANKPPKLFDDLRGNRIEVKDPIQENIEQFWKPYLRQKRNLIDLRIGIKLTKMRLISREPSTTR